MIAVMVVFVGFWMAIFSQKYVPDPCSGTINVIASASWDAVP
jgi:hypothetical protein